MSTALGGWRPRSPAQGLPLASQLPTVAEVLARMDGKPYCKECGDPDDHGGAPHSSVHHQSSRRPILGASANLTITDELDRDAWRQLSQMPVSDNLTMICSCGHGREEHDDGAGRCWKCACESYGTRTPVLAIRRPVAMGDQVRVWWGENRDKVGTITGRQSGAWFVHFEGGVKGSGLHVEDALLVVVDGPPAFESAEQAELWLESSGEQEHFPGETVRLSEVRGRDRAIQHVRIVKYLGVQGKEPPKYLVDNHGEPQIVPAYFIRGKA